MMLVVGGAFPGQLGKWSTFTDSLCSLASLKKETNQMKLFFGNRVSEIRRLRQEMTSLRAELDATRFIPGRLNPADVGTRAGVKMNQLGPGSVWQHGPSFLKLPRAQWPEETNLVARDEDFPGEEIRRSVSTTVLATTRSMTAAI